jgi:MinD-like ATPase involved in chromosome partitioning or flagellar assembly
MSNQAAPLYQLVMNARPPHPGDGDRQGLVVVTGSAAGVGTTLVAVHLASALAGTGRTVAFVDADPVQPTATRQFGLAPTGGTWDLFRGWADIEKVIEPISPVISVVPGGKLATCDVLVSRAGRSRMIESLRQLGSQFAWTVVDAGARNGMIVPVIVPQADLTLLVADDRAGPIDTYAAVKGLAGSPARSHEPHPIMLMVNRVSASSEAPTTNQYLADTAGRFLSMQIWPAGYLYENEDPARVLAKFVQSLDAGRAIAETEKKDLSIQLAASEGR